MSAGVGRRSADSEVLGRRSREALPRRRLAEHVVTPERPSPVELLHSSDAGREVDLLPLKYERMSVSAFAFYRGFAAMHAYDLGQGPSTGVQAQLCGDMHLSNFGVYASPERRLLFDVNDFDETHPGPFEWDVKRLVTSFAVLGRTRGFSAATTGGAVLAAANAYRTRMQLLASMNHLSVWYDRIDEDLLREMAASMAGNRARKNLDANLAKARGKTHARAAAKLTEIVDGRRRFRSDPPLLVPVEGTAAEVAALQEVVQRYRSSLSADRGQLLQRYRVVDIARKVVGVGSVGTRCWVLLLEGRDPEDLLVLQAKETGPSVLEPYTQRSPFRHHGRRVVEGQRLMQAASDIFLGWANGLDATRQFYVRQLHDMKGGVDTEQITPTGLMPYASLCGMALAHAHARGGDATAIATYLGSSDRADRSFAEYAEAYADQNERDFAAFMASRNAS
jgi:uncharacterized protein (DUF2252 family)